MVGGNGERRTEWGVGGNRQNRGNPWCWDCGEKVVVPDREQYICGCDRKWFIDMTDDEALFVVDVDGAEIPLDRRSRR